jgi:hypothetical protein
MASVHPHTAAIAAFLTILGVTVKSKDVIDANRRMAAMNLRQDVILQSHYCFVVVSWISFANLWYDSFSVLLMSSEQASNEEQWQ